MKTTFLAIALAAHVAVSTYSMHRLRGVVIAQQAIIHNMLTTQENTNHTLTSIIAAEKEQDAINNALIDQIGGTQSTVLMLSDSFAGWAPTYLVPGDLVSCDAHDEPGCQVVINNHGKK